MSTPLYLKVANIFKAEIEQPGTQHFLAFKICAVGYFRTDLLLLHAYTCLSAIPSVGCQLVSDET